jgi:plastocyanin
MRKLAVPRLALCLAAGALLLSACGGGGGGSTAVTNCPPSGPHLSITAKNFAFDTSCLAVRSGSPFTITLHNDDSATAHDVSIYTDSSAQDALFQGKLVTGVATQAYDVKALPAGRYFFRCDVHPQMNGTFIVK